MADIIAFIVVILPFGAVSTLLFDAFRTTKSAKGSAWMDTLRV